MPAKSPAKLLVNAESFGFGPSAAIASFFPYLREKFEYIAYVGTGHSLDLQRTLSANGQYYDAVFDISGPKGSKRFEQIVSEHDIFLTALDFERATTARKLAKPTIIYDPLTWYWPSIPAIVKDADTLYIAQDFHGVKERLEKEKDRFTEAKIVSPIIPEFNQQKAEEYVLINLGGLKNPFWTDEQATEYARIVIETLKKVIPEGEKIKILTSKQISETLGELGAKTFNRDKMIDLFPQVKYAVMTSGLGNIYDVAGYDIPTLFLPPSNDSQALQLELMNREGTADASIDWAQIFPDNAIDYTASQQVIAEKITEAVERIKSDPVARQKFEDACRAAIKKLEKLHHSSTSKLVKEFGTGGAEQVANAVEEFAAKHTALEATQALKTKEYFAMAGGINASFTSDSEIGLSELQRLHLAAHLPRIQPLEHAPKVIDVQIHHSESGETTMQQNGSHVELSDNWNGKLSPDFPYLFYGAARLAWLNKNMYPVHAACVGNENDGYVLLVGHSGVGKTSSTLQSAFSSGLKVFSGDKTLITIANDGEMRAIGGTKTMTIRAEDKKRWPSLEGQGLMNGDRYIFPLKPEQSSSEFSVKIKAIVLLKLNDGVTKCQKLTPLSSLHTMYPYFMDMEWNDVLVGSGKAVFDGTPNNSVKPQLAQRLGNSLNQIPTFNISGSLPRVTSMINSIANANEQDIQRIHLRLGQGRQL